MYTCIHVRRISDADSDVLEFHTAVPFIVNGCELLSKVVTVLSSGNFGRVYSGQLTEDTGVKEVAIKMAKCAYAYLSSFSPVQFITRLRTCTESALTCIVFNPSAFFKFR